MRKLHVERDRMIKEHNTGSVFLKGGKKIHQLNMGREFAKAAMEKVIQKMLV